MSGLTARQRKHVYMRSSIFDDEGPSVKNIYNSKNQASVLQEVERLEAQGKQPPDPHIFDLPCPTDFRLSQNAGHNVVFGPGTEKCPEVHANKEPAIPREYWKSDVNLHWADPRNELNRSRMREQTSTGGMAVHPTGDTEVTAKERNAFEQSSGLFDWERMTAMSTQHPHRELQSCSEHFLANQTLAHKDEDLRPEQRMRINLEASTSSTFRGRDGSPEAVVATPNEDPAGASRRRKEKNFSDIFGTHMPERTEVMHRSGATDSQSCSWLDARAEVEAREKAAGLESVHEKRFEERNATERRLNELQSRVLLGSDEAPAPDMGTRMQRRTTDQRNERICWETNTLMEAGSELARREMGREFGNENQSAWARKCAEQASTNLGEDSAVVDSVAGKKLERITVPAPERGETRPMSAMDRKQQNLSSSIF